MPTADHVRDGDIGKDSQKPEVSVAAAAAKSLQSCPTLCDPIDGSPPGFPVPGILQARTLVLPMYKCRVSVALV